MAFTTSGRTAALVALAVTATLASGIGFGATSAAAGTAATLSPTPRAAGAASTHAIAASGAFDGNLTGVTVDYEAAGDLAGADVETLGVDRDGDGAADATVAAEASARASTVRVEPRENLSLGAGDRVVLVLAGVENPASDGEYEARVAVRADAGTYAATATYRVTPFPMRNTTARDVTTARAAFDGVAAVDSAFDGLTVTGSDWRDVGFRRTAATDVRSTADRLRGVRFGGATLAGFASDRSTYEDVAFRGTTLADVRISDSGFERVSVGPAAPGDGDQRPVASADVDSVLGVDAGSVAPVDATAVPAVGAGDSSSLVDASSASLLDRAETAADEARGVGGAPGGNSLVDVTVADSTLRNVTLANATLENVTFRDVTLRNVTLRNVTLRDAVITGRDLPSGTVAGETVTGERELVFELRTDDGLGDEVGTSATLASGENVTVGVEGPVALGSTTGADGSEGGASTSPL